MQDIVEVQSPAVYASFFSRLIARIIDGLLIMIPTAMLHPRLSYMSVIVGLLYFPVFEGSVLQATPGKRLMDIIVADENGQRLSIRKSIIRFFMSLVSGLFMFVGYFFYFFTKRKQTLHDLVAETLVLKGKKEGHLADAWISQLKLWFK